MAKRDPREVEMVAIVNMQPVPDDVIQGIKDIETFGVSILDEPAPPKSDEEEEEEVEEILKPGTKIRPDVDTTEAKKLAERLYGIVTKDISELISYDDRNFLIHVDRNIKNPIIANHWPHGYILKITNKLDSKKVGFIDAQTQLMLFLAQQNIHCPRPVMNINGKYFSTTLIGETKHNVRVLEFIPGKIFHEVPKTSHLFYQAGEFIARIDNALKNFKHDAYARHRTLWMFDSIPRLEEFLFAVKDEEKKEIVEQVLAAFDTAVGQHQELFAKGIIHGDFNEQNILVGPISADRPDDYKITGVIDFGDTSYSCYVYELAIAIAYMILQSGDIATGGLVMAGYSMVRKIPDHERKVLKVCVAARLCQSLVLGAYSYSLDPSNDYLLTTQHLGNGWEILGKLWAEPDDKLLELWATTADKYLTQSTK